MSFLNPILLAGLPLAALPILIHLIYRQRHQTLPWAAMMFLLDAQRLTRGMARLRFWVIMALRMLAIAALIIAVSRPLASGWVGLTLGGRPDTTLILLDRSPSMEQQDLQMGQSKRAAALEKLADLMSTWGGESRIVLIDSATNRAQPLESPDALLQLPTTQPTSATADIPAMLETAHEYLTANQSGRTDVWICSDLRRSDWNPNDGRWAAIRAGFDGLDAVRFYLLSYPEIAADNISVRVENVRRRGKEQGSELVMDVHLRRAQPPRQPIALPLELSLTGGRSVIPIELADDELVLQGHTVSLDAASAEGWGTVQLPNDANDQDNIYYFTFAEPPIHRTAIVSDDPQVTRAIEAAVTAPVDASLTYEAVVLPVARGYEVDWEAASLVVWHGAIPSDAVVRGQLEQFVASGRPVIFLPPEAPGSESLFGISWGAWQTAPADQHIPVLSWRGDSDLLRHTQSGSPLPVGKLRTFRYAMMEGKGTTLAQLDGGAPLLMRAAGEGPAYFCATLPKSTHSSLVQEGVTFYVMLQRALALGADRQGLARQYVAGSAPVEVVAEAKPVSPELSAVLSTERPFHAGVLQRDTQWLALNRSLAEDTAGALEQETLGELFGALDYRHVEDQVGNTSSLANEIWRAFLFAMAAALLGEGLLCLPERSSRLKVTP